MTFDPSKIYNHEAIYFAYPNAASVQDGYGVYDSDGNEIEIDQATVDAVAVEVATNLAWQFLREERDRRMAETDWWATSDRTMTAEQTAYRQSLRDLPANTTDPANPVWPTKP